MKALVKKQAPTTAEKKDNTTTASKSDTTTASKPATKPALKKANIKLSKPEKYGINVTIRREMGSDIDGACGQLSKSYMEKS